VKIRARPRQLPDGGWLQAVLRRNVPAGYCADHVDKPHATMAKAEGCWRDYLVGETLQLTRPDGEPLTRGDSGPCKACGTETNGTVVINGYPRDHWCPTTCATAENVAKWWNAVTAAMLAEAS
jgi:hypothetical protein